MAVKAQVSDSLSDRMDQGMLFQAHSKQPRRMEYPGALRLLRRYEELISEAVGAAGGALRPAFPTDSGLR